MVSGHGFGIAAALFPAIVLLIALTYCTTGYLIARRRRLGAWLGVTVAILTLPLQFIMHLDIMWTSLTPGWLITDALLLAVLLTSWRLFDQRAPGDAGSHHMWPRAPRAFATATGAETLLTDLRTYGAKS